MDLISQEELESVVATCPDEKLKALVRVAWERGYERGKRNGLATAIRMQTEVSMMLGDKL